MSTAYHSQVTVQSAGELRQTPLRAVHERLGATMTGFAGWLMPLRYGSETAEHNAVRRSAGLFDLSHMGEISVTGPEAAAGLDYALTGLLSAVAEGRARYTMLCAPDGGVLDDLVVYRQAADRFLVVANAANTALVHEELRSRCADALVTDETAEHALIAIQGPDAAGILAKLTSAEVGDLRYYAGCYADVAGRRAWVARTGYTGEDGFEIFCRPGDAEHIWAALTGAADPGTAPLSEAGHHHAALVPAGLAARDTLRLEAGMPLYGNELGPDVTPYDAGLGRVVKLEKQFVGRDALAARAAEPPRRVLAGLTMRSRRVPRHGYPVLAGPEAAPAGTVTSGAPSPTLGAPIAMAYLDAAAKPPFAVDIRGKAEPADPVDLPFYRRSKQG
jgi:aminomethyltransferase